MTIADAKLAREKFLKYREETNTALTMYWLTVLKMELEMIKQDTLRQGILVSTKAFIEKGEIDYD